MEKLTIYHLDENGAFLAAGEADQDPLSPGQFLVPAHACIVPPPAEAPAGKQRRFDAVSQVWYLHDLPAPEPEPQPPSAAELRKGEILSRLSRLDMESIRGLRAKSVGKGKAADDDRLAALDAEADALRVELAALGVG